MTLISGGMNNGYGNRPLTSVPVESNSNNITGSGHEMFVFLSPSSLSIKKNEKQFI